MAKHSEEWLPTCVLATTLLGSSLGAYCFTHLLGATRKEGQNSNTRIRDQPWGFLDGFLMRRVVRLALCPLRAAHNPLDSGKKEKVWWVTSWNGLMKAQRWHYRVSSLRIHIFLWVKIWILSFLSLALRRNRDFARQPKMRWVDIKLICGARGAEEF